MRKCVPRASTSLMFIRRSYLRRSYGPASQVSASLWIRASKTNIGFERHFGELKHKECRFEVIRAQGDAIDEIADCPERLQSIALQLAIIPPPRRAIGYPEEHAKLWLTEFLAVC